MSARVLLGALLVTAALAGCAAQTPEKASFRLAQSPVVKTDGRNAIQWSFKLVSNGTIATPFANASMTVDLLGGPAGTARASVLPTGIGRVAFVNVTTPFGGIGDYSYLFEVKSTSDTLLRYRGFYEYCGFFPC